MALNFVYTAYSGTALLAVGDRLPLGVTVHRAGCAVRAEDGAIRVRSAGYYQVTVSATVSPTAPGEAGLRIMLNGLPVEGGIANAVTAAASQETDISAFAVVRIPCCDVATISAELTGSGATVTDVTTIVERM